MPMEDYLYQKDPYVPLKGKAKKPETIKDAEWELLDRKALSTDLTVRCGSALLHS